jgi:hypothetical protein
MRRGLTRSWCRADKSAQCVEASPHRDDQRAGTVEARNARLHVDSVRGQLVGYQKQHAAILRQIRCHGNAHMTVVISTV